MYVTSIEFKNDRESVVKFKKKMFRLCGRKEVCDLL